MTIHESILDGIVDIRTHKVRTFLQTLGVILGVGSLVAVQGLADAGRRQAVNFFAENGGLTKIFVGNREPAETIQTAKQLASAGLTWDDALALKRDVAHARLVDPASNTYQLVRYGEYRRKHTITAVTPDYSDVYRFHVDRGRFVIDSDLASSARVCVLGDTAARTYFGNEDPLGKTLYIGDEGFLVVGVMKRKEFYFRDDGHNALEWMNRLTFIPLTTLYTRFTGDPDRKVDYINVVVDSVKNNQKAAGEIEAVLERRHGGVRDFELYRRDERIKRQEERGQIFDIVFMASGVVALLVGGIVIMNIMLASFQERIREVGIRKSLGARGGDIAVQFLVESVLVTSIGGAAGLPLGILFARGITALLGSPAVITPRMAIVSVATSVTVGLFFGLYPAVKAARLNPVEALRYE
ncbi:MAG TPA: ABC transporter permease [Candidatus Saccharimonadales bacterium]|nr:ABC transporter permease [Candidatus Saccharimonadales bacterium]